MGIPRYWVVGRVSIGNFDCYKQVFTSVTIWSASSLRATGTIVTRERRAVLARKGMMAKKQETKREKGEAGRDREEEMKTHFNQCPVLPVLINLPN